MGRRFSRHIQQVDGEVLKQEAHENLKTLKHQQFNKHLVGEGLGIEGGAGWGCIKLLNNNFILRQMKINCRGAQRNSVQHRGYRTA